MRVLVKQFSYLFALAGIVFIPINLFPGQNALTDFLFKNILVQIAENVFGLSLVNPDISSDSTLMYCLLALLFVSSLLVALLLLFVKKENKRWAGFETLCYKLFAFYLALLLMEYGFDKVFKSQFYLPEPNILFTPFGKLDKDILFWSCMGTSHGYNLFAGLLEVIAALLILVKPTRVLGLLLALGLVVNIVAINLGFDISVKLLSFFLLFLNLILLAPNLSILYRFIVLKANTSLLPEASIPNINRGLKTALNAALICYILVKPAYPYLVSGNFNDDLAKRPYLHGAYEVMKETPENDATMGELSDIKRFYIHRDDYLIIENTQGEMQDFKLELDKAKGRIILTDYDANKINCMFSYSQKDSVLRLLFIQGKKACLLNAKALNWRNMPALKGGLHWRSDS